MSLRNIPRGPRAAGLLLAALLAAPAAPAAPAVAADLAPLPEPEIAWKKFLAEGDADASFKLYDLIDVVEGEDIVVDVEPCKQHAPELDAALRQMPVSIALWYTAYRCADVRGEADAAEHYLTGFSRLAKHALGQASDDVEAPPIRVFAYPDIRMIMQASDMQLRYSLLDDDRPRHLEIIEAIEDKDAGRERRLRFDYLDTLVRLARDEPESQYPPYRKHLADAIAEGLAKGGTQAGKDLRAVRLSAEAGTLAGRVAVLRPAATAGGVQSTWEWMYACAHATEATCADGLVDALLPGAEARHATALVLLGVAHAEGIGVKRDEKYAMALLDAADAQLGGGQGTVMFARYQLGLREGKMSTGLHQRIEKAAADGHPFAARLLATQRYDDQPGYVATDADLAPLIALDAKGNSQVAGTIGAMLFAAGRHADAVKWVAKGAAAGHADSQWRYAWLLDEGYGQARDPAAAGRWRREAANGGNVDAMRKLAVQAGGRGDWKAAEQWLLGAMLHEDLDGAIQLATYYGEGHPGLGRPPEHGVELLERLEASMHRVEIRQALAHLYAAGKGVKADPAKARALLEKDAEAGDRHSQMLLAHGLALGELGPKDDATAERWFARAAADGDLEALDAHAFFLFYRLDTPESRVRGLALWRKVAADTQDAEFIWNNLSWALCTGRDASLRAPEEGLKVIGRMGEIALLPLGFRDTVAACQAAAGRHAEAARLQRSVIERVESDNAGDPSLPEMRARLKLYEAGKAYVEEKAE